MGRPRKRPFKRLRQADGCFQRSAPVLTPTAEQHILGQGGSADGLLETNAAGGQPAVSRESTASMDDDEDVHIAAVAEDDNVGDWRDGADGADGVQGGGQTRLQIGSARSVMEIAPHPQRQPHRSTTVTRPGTASPATEEPTMAQTMTNWLQPSAQQRAPLPQSTEGEGVPEMVRSIAEVVEALDQTTTTGTTTVVARPACGDDGVGVSDLGSVADKCLGVDESVGASGARDEGGGSVCLGHAIPLRDCVGESEMVDAKSLLSECCDDSSSTGFLGDECNDAPNANDDEAGPRGVVPDCQLGAPAIEGIGSASSIGKSAGVPVAGKAAATRTSTRGSRYTGKFAAAPRPYARHNKYAGPVRGKKAIKVPDDVRDKSTETARKEGKRRRVAGRTGKHCSTRKAELIETYRKALDKLDKVKHHVFLSLYDIRRTVV